MKKTLNKTHSKLIDLCVCFFSTLTEVAHITHAHILHLQLHAPCFSYHFPSNVTERSY